LIVAEAVGHPFGNLEDDPLEVHTLSVAEMRLVGGPDEQFFTT
jgi:hypothetical protein